MFADQHLEESKHDFPLLPAKKTHTPVLLVHAFLHHSPYDYVYSGSYSPILGRLLYPSQHVISQHTPSSKIIPFHCPLSPLRKHHVGDQVQCHDLRPISTRKCI